VTLALAGLLYIAFGVLFGRVMELGGQVRALSLRDSRTRLPARSDGMLTYGRVLCFLLAGLTFIGATFQLWNYVQMKQVQSRFLQRW